MTRVRNLIFGKIDGRSKCVQFAYGCVCHTLSSLVKNLCRVTFIKDTLSKEIKLTRLFRNTRIANTVLKSARENTATSPPTIKSYSTTRWAGVAVLFKSVLLNKDLVAGVFANKE